MGKSSEKEAGQVRGETGKGTLCSCWVDGSRKKEQWYSLRKPLEQAWDLDLPAPPRDAWERDNLERSWHTECA